MKILNGDQRKELMELQNKVDRALLSIFKIIQQDKSLGDKDGKQYNEKGLQVSGKYLRACNKISEGFEVLNNL